MKPFVLLVCALVVVFFAGDAQSSHYRGGAISYKPNPSSPYSAQFTFRLSFRRSSVHCDESTIASRSLVYASNRWHVTRHYWPHSSSSYTGSASIYCTGFNVREDWSEGNNTFTFSGSSADDWWNVRITDGGNWISGITHSNPSDIMRLEARVNRTFNNSSPVSSLPLTVYVVQGIPSVIYVTVEDPDGDIVRCRKASYQECYRGMCTYFPHGVLDEGNCTLRYNGGGSAGQLFPIILKLEDFPSGTTLFDSSNSLGSVDLQFVVHIKNVTDAVRIQDGGSSGQLQVLHNGVWGTVCDDEWTMTNTHVVCRQLGFTGALSYTSRGGGTGPIWLDDVQCSGTESAIQQCRHSEWGSHNCRHSEDVFVSCYPTECNSYTVLSSPDRAASYGRGTPRCDRNDITPGWYRFMGDAGIAIATSCIPENHCGTHAAGWMQGSHPTQAEGIVTRRVCYSWSNNCCRENNDIRVKNCGGFYVYELVKPPYCTLRYCGSNETGINPCNSITPCRNGGTCYGGPGWYSCSCRNGFTGQQCETNLQTNVTCGENYMQIDLKDSYFTDIDWRNLHLKDQSCRATKTADTRRLRTPLDRCDTTYTEDQKTITFWNEVKTDNRYQPVGNRSVITRDRNLVVRFFCAYERSRFVSTSFLPSKKTVVASEGSYGNFTFTMDLYQTSRYQTTYSPFAYPVVVYPNQPLWVQYAVKNTNADLVVFAENCHATPSNDPKATPQHIFLQRGCVRDPTMTYSHNSSSNVQRFSITSFRFVYYNTFLVYLHCELLVCHRNTNNSRCAQGCISGSRGRRETTDMDGSKAYDLSAGPLKGGKVNTKSNDQEGSLKSKQLIGGLGAVGGVFFVFTTLLLVIIYRNRRRGQNNKPTSITLDVTVNSYEQDNVDSDEKNDIEL